VTEPPPFRQGWGKKKRKKKRGKREKEEKQREQREISIERKIKRMNG
jgi:hypothetical protein